MQRSEKFIKENGNKCLACKFSMNRHYYHQDVIKHFELFCTYPSKKLIDNSSCKYFNTIDTITDYEREKIGSYLNLLILLANGAINETFFNCMIGSEI